MSAPLMAINGASSLPPRGAREYTRYSRYELVTFAEQRGLRVLPKPNNPWHPYYDDYVEALQREDERMTFRFFDLPGELRNQIYLELLTMTQNRSTGATTVCFPQILRTCKQVHCEAKNILYAENRITIRITPQRIEAHGIPCGSYIPAGTYDEQGCVERQYLESIKWPEFLRRVWSIKLSVPDGKWKYVPSVPGNRTRRVPVRQRLSVIHTIFYSLCSMLSSNHNCRTLSFDDQLSPESTLAQIRAVYYPSKLLGPQWDVMNTTNHGKIYLHDQTTRQQAAQLRKSICPLTTALFRKGRRLIGKCLDLGTGWTYRLAGILACCAFVIREATDGYYFNKNSTIPIMVNTLRHELCWGAISADLVGEINQFLLLEIELRTTRKNDETKGVQNRWKSVRCIPKQPIHRQ